MSKFSIWLMNLAFLNRNMGLGVTFLNYARAWQVPLFIEGMCSSDVQKNVRKIYFV